MVAPINTIPQVVEFPPIRDTLLETRTPAGKPVRLPPPSVEREHLKSVGRCLPYAPSYAEDTEVVLCQAGFSGKEIVELRESGIIT